ncbi:MAG: NADH-quinone oxidoreductase subunit L [Candidatus Riflebacteria bacterium]|nr:NADH-quinone oxidoreductase subunit L [Candidatus Riflebacteria bacterium]
MNLAVVFTFLLPLCGALINGFLGQWFRKDSGTVAGTIMFGSFMCALIAFFQNQASPIPSFTLWHWFPISDTYTADMRILVDHLSLTMAVMVTGVGFLIHVFAVGYMDHEAAPERFFCYLNFFVVNMLLLVFSDNLVMMFVFWEGVGLMSYLLIGFWYYKPEAASAGKKAFVMNRVGDTGFVLAIFWLFYYFHTFNILEIAGKVKELPESVVTGITLLLFLAVTGKSAQLPLFTWLPDAMEGPTPVSALIHAATMVTAGIYMVTRNHALFNLYPNDPAHMVILTVGALTALVAAAIALGQNDIKKVLAYSTVSQLGFMVMALGVGCYIQAVFHLLTHACFKALLFLTAGAVIYGMHHEQDMTKMGGLAKRMPMTAACFIIGCLALAGFPLTAGYFSKDAILSAVLLKDHPYAWAAGLLAAVFTGFYSTRAVWLTFFGEWRSSHAPDHIHETPRVMLMPLMILAVLALGAGFAGWPEGSGMLYKYLEVTVKQPELKGHLSMANWLATILPGLIGIALGLFFYARGKSPAPVVALFGPIGNWFVQKLYLDEIYEFLIVEPTKIFAQACYYIGDKAMIDGFLHSWYNVCAFGGSRMRRLHSGHLHATLASFLAGVVALFAYILVRGY